MTDEEQIFDLSKTTTKENLPPEAIEKIELLLGNRFNYFYNYFPRLLTVYGENHHEIIDFFHVYGTSSPAKKEAIELLVNINEELESSAKPLLSVLAKSQSITLKVLKDVFDIEVKRYLRGKAL